MDANKLRTMMLDDLDIDIKNSLLESRKNLCSEWKENTAYRVCFTNPEGTRYFRAVRCCVSWSDDKGNYMPFGGGTYWEITYGKILWTTGKDVMGQKTYYWVQSNKTFGKSSNGTIIPTKVGTKKEVLEIAKNIGILVI